MSVDGGVLCVMNEGLEGLKEILARDGVCWFEGGGGWWVGGWVKGCLGRGVRYGYGASVRGMCRGVVGKIRQAGQGDSRDGKMVVVELAPVAKACEVDREMD